MVMNVCNILGEIVEEIRFDFMYKGNCISIARSKMLCGSSVVDIYGYDNVADYMYKRLCVGDIVFVYGRVSKLGILCKYILKV